MRKVGYQEEIDDMNSGTRFGIRLLLACMSFAFVFSVFFVSTPSIVVASPGWENILWGDATTYNYDCWPPAPWHNYPVGSNPLEMAACEAGSGRVVATSASWSIRNNYIGVGCSGNDMEEMIDVVFRWLAPGKARSEIRVLWYKGYDVYDQNTKEQCTYLVTYLTTHWGGSSYNTNNIVSDGTEPIAAILPGNYDIVFIPQLQPGGEANEGIGGDPTLIPDSDYEAMRHFVEDLGKGLLVMEGCDYSSSGPFGHCHFRVQNKIIETIENGMYFQSDEIKTGTTPFDVPFVVNTAHWIGSTYESEHGSTTCLLDSIGSMTSEPEPPHPGMSGVFFPSFNYGEPGAILSYEVTVTNSGTIFDNYNLTAVDNAGWGGIVISPNKLTNIAPMTLSTATLSITIPGGASQGDMTKITVTITSENDPSLSKYAYASAHVAEPPVEPVIGVWTFVQLSPRILNYNTCVEGAGESIYILNNTQSSADEYIRGDYFMRYNTVTGCWEDLHLPPGGFKNNAHQMCWDKGNYIYATSGGSYADAAGKSRHEFWRYNIANDSWETLPDTPMWQGPGDALVWVKLGANEYIYAWLGTTSYSVILSYGTDPEAEFWRFNISENEWDQFLRHVDGYTTSGQTASPAQKENGIGADDGCNLIWTGGDYIYYTPGAYNESLPKEEERYFLRYSISTNTLVEMAKAPSNDTGGFDDGGSLVYPGGDYIYTLKGGSDPPGGSVPGDNFWRYRISNGSWEILPNLPWGVGEMNGCRMGYASGGNLCYWVGPNNEYVVPGRNLYVYGIVVPGVEVSITPAENSAENGKTVTFTVTITNTGTTGTVSDTYTLENTDNAGWTKSLSKSSVGPLAPGASENVTLTVTIPGGATPCTRDSITITATSQTDNIVKDSASCTAHAIKENRGVAVSISPPYQSILVGENFVFTVTVKNTGTVSDTYNLTKWDNENWALALENISLTIPAGENRATALTVTVPDNAVECTHDNVWVRATSQTDITAWAENSCIAHATENVIPGVEVSISPSERENSPGGTVTFTVTVKNTGNASDSYNLTKGDNAGWTLSIQSTVGPISPGASQDVTLTVTISSDAENCTHDNVWVRATSQTDNTVENEDSCIAHAVGVGRVKVSIDPTSESGAPGEKLTFTVTVTNLGSAADTFMVEATNTENWALTVSPTSFSLSAGGSRNVGLTVTIPSTAADGDSTTITVTATGTGYENSATCTATAVAGGISSLVYVGVVVVIVGIIAAILIFIKPF